MQKKRTTLMPLMLAGITLATSAAAPPPQKVPEVKLPASYTRFYPSAQSAKSLLQRSDRKSVV